MVTVSENKDACKKKWVVHRTKANLPSTYVVSQLFIPSHSDSRSRRQRRNGRIVGRKRVRHNLRNHRRRVHEDIRTSLTAD
jgi:hypothetical protein